MEIKLRLTQTQHRELQDHLLPGDGLEAVAVASCGRSENDRHNVLTVHQIEPIPYAACKVRGPDRVTWSTERLVPLLEAAGRRDLAILKIHSHPGGYAKFSTMDDESDRDVFGSVFVWTDSTRPQASAVMLPDGSMFGRAILPDVTFAPLSSIMVPGDDLSFWASNDGDRVSAFAERHRQLFGAGTIRVLRQLAVAVVGCSGTGSPLIEQLARLGVGRLVLIDPDFIEDKNLNRIVNSRREDAYLKRPKVEVMARAIAAMGFDTEVGIIADNLATPSAVRAVATCDVVFGCMDGVEGRHLLNRLASFYSLPYFDLGVKLVADGSGGIDEAVGAVHYIRPDGGTLQERGVYTADQLKAAGLLRTDPKAYREQLRAGYLHRVAEDRPAVISINMQLASLAVNEFLARLHPYRHDDNAESAIVRVDFIGNAVIREKEPPPTGSFMPHIGKGDVRPLLSMPSLSEAELE